MRYLKRFNEELKPATYNKAAAELRGLGHSSRAAELDSWAKTSKELEDARNLKKKIDKYSKHGVWKIVINSSPEIEGNFYLCLDFDKDRAEEIWEDWESDGRPNEASLWLLLGIGLIPADEETFVLCKENLDFWNDIIYWASDLGLKISDPCGDESPYDSGQWELELTNPKHVCYIEGNEYRMRFADRQNANKFRKLIIDIFQGNVEMGETSEFPGGVKEEIIDFLCNKKGVSIEEFDNMVDFMRNITVNSFYRD
jgi:hypothetical protein